LGTGVIILDFHCVGTTDHESERLYNTERGLAKKGAETRKNQEGTPSNPWAVGFKQSNILKT
jgi:hypothetical protein